MSAKAYSVVIGDREYRTGTDGLGLWEIKGSDQALLLGRPKAGPFPSAARFKRFVEAHLRSDPASHLAERTRGGQARTGAPARNRLVVLLEDAEWAELQRRAGGETMSSYARRKIFHGES